MKMSGFNNVSQSRTLKMRSKMKSSEKPHKMKAAKKLSSDPLLSCRVFCNICDRLYFLSGLRKHVAHKHSITYTEYKLRYGGDPKRQIINTVYHPCLLCKKVVLLDTTELGKHLKEHGLGYTQYMKEHMKKGSGLITASRVTASSSSSSKAAPTQRRVQPPVPATPAGPRTRSQSKLSPVQSHTSISPATPRSLRTPVQTSAPSSDLILPPSPPITPPAIKKEPQEILPYFAVKQEPMEVVEAVSPGLVIIQCDLCFKVFKHNMQLRGHMRKSH